MWLKKRRKERKANEMSVEERIYQIGKGYAETLLQFQNLQNERMLAEKEVRDRYEDIRQMIAESESSGIDPSKNKVLVNEIEMLEFSTSLDLWRAPLLFVFMIAAEAEDIIEKINERENKNYTVEDCLNLYVRSVGGEDKAIEIWKNETGRKEGIYAVKTTLSLGEEQQKKLRNLIRSGEEGIKKFLDKGNLKEKYAIKI